MIRKSLERYIEENVFPEYEKNDEGHGIEHIWSVVRRSLKFAKQVSDINEEMVYVIASYHDIGVSIDRKHHEKVSADRNTDVDAALKRTYTYRLKHFPHLSLDEIIEDSRGHLIEKFGVNGYSRENFILKI